MPSARPETKGLSIWQYGEVWLLVTETHEQLPDASIIGGVYLGGNFGSGNSPGVAMLSSERLSLFYGDTLRDDTPYDGLIIPEIGPYPLVQDVTFAWFGGTTLSSIASASMGGYLHELGHAFAMMHHDFRNDANFHGNLMGNGFRGLRGSFSPDRYPDDYARLSYGAAHILNTSHYFNEGLVTSPVDEASVSVVSSTPQNGHISFDVTASDSDGLSLITLYEGGLLRGEKQLSGTSFNGRISTPYYEAGAAMNFVIKVSDQQGNRRDITKGLSPEPGHNSGPRPFVKVTPAIGDPADTFRFDASNSSDPDDARSELMVEWDLDFDGVFETSPSQTKTHEATGLYPGNRFVQARVTDPSGAQSLSAPIALHVEGEVVAVIESFTLIDSETDQPIAGFDPIPEAAVIDVTLFPSELNIRANTAGSVESVLFGFDGKQVFRIENVAPYALFGDYQGNYFDGHLRVGAHSLTATPYFEDRAGGTPGTSQSLNFTVVDPDEPIISQFILIDADPDADLFALADSMRLDLSALPPNLNIRAEVEGDVKSVRFTLKPQGHWHTENIPPYALFGDDDGDYLPGYYRLGEQALTAIAYDEAGEASEPLSIAITFTRSANLSSRAPSPRPTLTALPADFSLEPAYPNPFNAVTTIRYAVPEASPVRLIVYDMLGREVRRLVDGVREAGYHEVEFDAGDLPSGSYLYRLETPGSSFTRRVLLLK